MTTSMQQTGSNTGLSRRNLMRGGGGALAAAALAACTSEKAPSSDDEPAPAADGFQSGMKVTFVVHGRNSFFNPVEAGYRQMASMLGWEADFVAPTSETPQLIAELQANVISAEPDGIITTRIDDTAFDENIQRALDRGIKVVLSNVASQGYEDLGVAFVGQDFGPAGETCGQEIARYATEKTGRTDGLIVCGNGAPGNSALETRIAGIQRGVAAYNDENGSDFVAEPFVSSFDANEAIGLIDAKYTSDGDEIVGFAMSGNDHLFAATWSEQNNLVGQLAIGGFDLGQPIMKAIKEGTIDFSLGQNPYAQGWVAASLLSMEIDPGFPASDYDTGAEVVDAGNVDTIMEREARYS